MLAGSFRIVTARLIPRLLRPKQALVLIAFILSGCGGSSAPSAASLLVRGNGFSFRAPAGWLASHSARQASATHGSDLVQVATFPLLKPYRPDLYDRVGPELRLRMTSIARQTGGRLDAGRSVTVAAIRSHSYRVTAGDRVDEYTFVLRGMREFQLLCRRGAAGDESFCAQLIASFRPA
jgi:hypothetical protein